LTGDQQRELKELAEKRVGEYLERNPGWREEPDQAITVDYNGQTWVVRAYRHENGDVEIGDLREPSSRDRLPPAPPPPPCGGADSPASPCGGAGHVDYWL
jgi:hypothetical protein